MIRPREKKTCGSLFVFTVLLLAGFYWIAEGMEAGTSLDAERLQNYLNHWNATWTDSEKDDRVYYVEGLPDVLFYTSARNDSLILADLSRCLIDFDFATCLKFLLLSRMNGILDFLRDNNLTEKDLSFFNGLVTFKTKGPLPERCDHYGPLDLDQDIASKLTELFGRRSLEVNLAPGIVINVNPLPGPNGAIDFRATPRFRWDFWKKVIESGRSGSGGKGNKKGGFQMPPMMIMPQLIMWGFMPFALANLQAMVMNAFMLNMMALNSAIFMTIRNLVFGPRGGPKIKYVNYGYKKQKSGVPTVIVHSPAAFVKQSFRRKKPPNPHFVILHEDRPTSYSKLHSRTRPNGNIHDGEVNDEHVRALENGVVQKDRRQAGGSIQIEEMKGHVNGK